MTTTTITLNNGIEMPALGFGVFQTSPEDTRAAVTSALQAGYRHIDTAAAYFNEKQVGEAIAESDLDRSEVFIETKLWISDYGYDQALHGFDKSAAKLGVDQIDLLLLHVPVEYDRTLEAYRALERLLADGKVRAIGVSNMDVDYLTRLLDVATVAPAVNQVELHPYQQQRELQAFHLEHDIVSQAWSPLGGITFYNPGSTLPSTLQDATLGAIAAAHGKSPAQVMLRWHLMQGRSAIPKSSNPARIAENIDVFDFRLTSDELAAIDALDQGRTAAPAVEGDPLGDYANVEIPEA